MHARVAEPTVGADGGRQGPAISPRVSEVNNRASNPVCSLGCWRPVAGNREWDPDDVLPQLRGGPGIAGGQTDRAAIALRSYL